MILKQHLDIDGVTFDIAIRKPPPVDEAGGKELDRWMRVITDVLELEAGQPFEWGLTPVELETDGLLPCPPLSTQLVHFKLKNMGPGQPRGNFEVEV